MDLSIFKEVSFRIADPDSLGMFIKDEFVPYDNWPEELKIRWNSPTMGKKITIYYPVDSYEEINPTAITYNSTIGFSPGNIIYLVFKHYSDPLTTEEMKRVLSGGYFPVWVEDEVREALEVTNTPVIRSDIFQNDPFFYRFDKIGPETLHLRFD